MKFNQEWTVEQVPLAPSEWLLREGSSSYDLHTGEQEDSNNDEQKLKQSNQEPNKSDDDPDVIRLEIVEFVTTEEEIKEKETSPQTT
jgi:hypothetical protein